MGEAECLQYTGHMEVRVSDHKPVSSVWRVQLRAEDAARRRDVFQAVVRTLDAIENRSLPDVVVSANSVRGAQARGRAPGLSSPSRGGRSLTSARSRTCAP